MNVVIAEVEALLEKPFGEWNKEDIQKFTDLNEECAQLAQYLSDDLKRYTVKQIQFRTLADLSERLDKHINEWFEKRRENG